MRYLTPITPPKKKYKRNYIKKVKEDDTKPIDKILFDKMLKASTFIKPPKGHDAFKKMTDK